MVGTLTTTEAGPFWFGFDAVEPAAWKVSLTKFTSGVLAVVGLWWILLGVGAME